VSVPSTLAQIPVELTCKDCRYGAPEGWGPYRWLVHAEEFPLMLDERACPLCQSTNSEIVWAYARGTEIKFALGQVVITPGFQGLFVPEGSHNPKFAEAMTDKVKEIVGRHMSGDWGDDVDPEDARANDAALKLVDGFPNGRVCSFFNLAERVSVITEQGRQSTTIALLSEY
jgi:hypothetical protein